MYSAPIKAIEVETRFFFKDQAEAFDILPFLAPCFTRNNRWKTVHFGPDLFQTDIMLRIGESQRETGNRIFLGWKGPDRGSFANIRAELDEEISAGIVDSQILTILGGEPQKTSALTVAEELIRLGHTPFMEFTGENRFGFYEQLNLHLKLMSCPVLAHPFMLEIEKTAVTDAEGLELERELLAFTRQYRLEDRVVRDEPTTLLYRTLGK
jgi:adenylate cyclase class IV